MAQKRTATRDSLRLAPHLSDRELHELFVSGRRASIEGTKWTCWLRTKRPYKPREPDSRTRSALKMRCARRTSVHAEPVDTPWPANLVLESRQMCAVCLAV